MERKKIKRCLIFDSHRNIMQSENQLVAVVGENERPIYRLRRGNAELRQQPYERHRRRRD